MTLDYTLLNEPTKLLQRLADAEEKLVAVRLLQRDLMHDSKSEDMTDTFRRFARAIANKITDAIGDK